MSNKTMLPPILLFAISYIIGVVIADSFKTGIGISIFFLTVSLIIHLLIIRKGSSLKIAPAALSFLCLGIILASITISRLDLSLLYRAAVKSSYTSVEGVLISDPTGQNGIFSFDLKVEKVVLSQSEWLTNEKLRVRVRSARQLKLYMGKRVRISGRLELPRSDGDFNYRRYLYHKGIMAVLNASPDDINDVDNGGFSIMSFAGSIRHWIKEKNLAYLSRKEAGLLNGIVLGDTSSIDEDLDETFRITGLTHILAASGMNIALLIGPLWPILRFLRLRSRTQVLILLASTALYTLISGATPSINRAFLMAAIMLIAWLLGKEANIAASLAVAAVILLIVDPFVLHDLGFQLSFAATASLIAFAPALERLMEDIPRSLRMPLSVTIAAQIGVFPVIVYYFGQVSAISLVANLIIVPLVAPALVLGMAVLPLETLFPVLAEPVYLVISVILKAMIYGTSLLSKIPGASVTLGQPSLIEVTFVYMLIAIGWLYLRTVKLRLRIGHVILMLVAISILSIWWQVGKSLTTSTLEVTFFDVGQGDSTILTSPDGTTLLIDSGPDPALVKRKIAGKGISKIDAVLVSHAHSDHIGGARKLFDTVVVGSLLYPVGIKDSLEFQTLLFLAKRKGIKCIPIKDGDILHLGRYLEIDTLYADIAEGGNDESAVVMVKYGKLNMLFTGDSGESVEQSLIKDQANIDAEILKVGHHGSASSSTRDFLREVSPEVSVISVGKNNMYGHPARSTIGRLLSAGSKIYRTDRNGDVTIKSDGKMYQVYVEKTGE